MFLCSQIPLDESAFQSISRSYGKCVLGFCKLGFLVVLIAVAISAKAEFVLSDFNGTGFNYTFEGFAQSTGPSAVRLIDTQDGWGGAGVEVGEIDLSAYANGYFAVDVIPQFGNSVNSFDATLIDVHGNIGIWTFPVSGLPPWSVASMISSSSLSSPPAGINDFQNLDLSRIKTWQVLGEYGSNEAFDISFDRLAISNSVTPPPPYPGIEPDAPWRTTAATQIDTIRKADLSINVVDAVGTPISGANILVEMQQHEFGFGTAVQAHRLRDNAATHDQYKNMTAALFNLATLENNLKWQPWENEWGPLYTQQGAIAALDWLSQNNLDARGHVLVWPGEDNLPADIRQIIDGSPITPQEQSVIRNRISTHIAEITAATNGKVNAWDVVNETRTNNDLMNLLVEGDDAIVDWFNLANSSAANTDLYINDFGILSSGGNTASSNQDHYYNTIQTLINAGAEIDGIGFQAHFREGDITGPEQLWTILDRFDQLGLKMQVTEFDFDTTNEELQAAYTRDFLTAMFAHEGISDVVQWGFWEQAHWRPDSALFRSDWSVKPNGQAYLDLVFNEWWTQEEITADAVGAGTVRGFKGDYSVSVSANGITETVNVSLSDNGLSLEVSLPYYVGDYNRDGSVDAADYTTWRDSLGDSVPTGTGADGNNDGLITEADYLIWRDNFGNTLQASSHSNSIPEPSTISILLMGSFLFVRPHMSRSRRLS